jgi:prephenate dehydrogenase
MTNQDTAAQDDGGGPTSPPVIGIVGLGSMGLAIGAALQETKKGYEIWGHDREPDLVRNAQERGAIDRGDWNLISVAEGSDLLYVTEPLEQLLDTLERVGAHMRPGTLVTDTASIKVPVLEAADRHLGEGCSFVGGHPIVGRLRSGREAGSLKGATYCLVPLPSAEESAVRTLSRMVEAIGAKPFYIDGPEHDALVAGVAHMPYIVEASMVRVLGGSPSAADLKRLAGSLVAGMMLAPEGGAASLREAVRTDSSGLVSWIDQLAADLYEIRQAIADGDDSALDDLLSSAVEVRRDWASLDQIDSAEAAAFDEVDDYGAAEHLLFGRLLRRKKR